MAKGEILENRGGGFYRVNLKYATDRVQGELVKINDRIAELAILAPIKKLEVVQLQEKVNNAGRDIDLLIPDYRSDPVANTEQMKTLQTTLIQLGAELAKSRYQMDLLIADNLSLLKRRGKIERIPKGKRLDAWCGDLTETLTGVVGLIDVNDEGGQGVIIQPGYEGAAIYDGTRDGQLVPREAQTGAQVWLNAALLPGVQKWRPRYRAAIIKNIAQDVCTITLLPAFSSAQTLPINSIKTYSDVPIQYMSCNGIAFEDGDRVLVRFTPFGPLVIGFESNPKACSIQSVIFQPALLNLENSYVDDDITALPNTWIGEDLTKYGKPYEDGSGLAINYPLGSDGGIDPAWKATPESGGFVTQRGEASNYGLANWIGRNGEVLSWRSRPGRLHDMASDALIFKELRDSHRLSTAIYYRQRSIDLSIGRILGAALWKDIGGQWWLYAVNSLHRIYRATADSDVSVIGSTEYLGQYQTEGTDFISVTGWYFSASGDRAVCTFKDTDDYGGQVKVARFNTLTGEITEELVFDKSEIIGQRTTTKTTSDNYAEPPDVRNFSEVTNINVSLLSYNVPLYYDFKGDTEIFAYAEIGGRESSSISGISGSIDGSYQGEQDRSETEGDTFGAVKIRTSDGITIAGAGESTSQSNRTTNFTVEDSRTFEVITQSGTINSSFTTNSLTLISIDARFGACLAKITRTIGSSIGSGQIPDTLPTFMAGTESRNIQESLVIFAGNVKKSEQTLVSTDETYAASFRMPIPGGGFGTELANDTFVTTTDLGKSAYIFHSPRLISFFAYQRGGVEFFTAIYIKELNEFNFLVSKPGPADLIDDALALDGGMCLFDAALV